MFYDTSLFIQMIATYICITIFTWLWIEKLGSDTFFVNIVLLYTIFTVFCTCKDTSDILQSKCNSINISIFSTTLTNCLIKSWCSTIGFIEWTTPLTAFFAIICHFFKHTTYCFTHWWLSWSWSYDSWIYN